MKHVIAAAALAAAASLGSIASAQTAPAAPAAGAATAEQGRHHGRFDPAQRRARFEQRMAELKAKLNISAAQEANWASFVNALRPPAERPRIDREALARMTTPDRIDQMRALRNQRIAEMDRKADATKAFYATLTAEQKQVFDAETARRFGGKHHGHHRMHG